MTERKPAKKGIWVPRYCSGETEIPEKYRWEVDMEDGGESITGVFSVKIRFYNDSSEYDNTHGGMTKLQATVIATALNALRHTSEE
jgi:hypothetical protein